MKHRKLENQIWIEKPDLHCVLKQRKGHNINLKQLYIIVMPNWLEIISGVCTAWVADDIAYTKDGSNARSKWPLLNRVADDIAYQRWFKCEEQLTVTKSKHHKQVVRVLMLLTTEDGRVKIGPIQHWFCRSGSFRFLVFLSTEPDWLVLFFYVFFAR